MLTRTVFAAAAVVLFAAALPAADPKAEAYLPFEPAKPGDNTPPAGFTALFNGKDLTGWKGLVELPQRGETVRRPTRQETGRGGRPSSCRTGPAARACCATTARATACSRPRITATSSCTPTGGSARTATAASICAGTPQVQFWEKPDVGSGGLYNNQKNPSKPTKVADRPVGQVEHVPHRDEGR